MRRNKERKKENSFRHITANNEAGICQKTFANKTSLRRMKPHVIALKKCVIIFTATRISYLIVALYLLPN